jgi:hypothetical protein
VLVAATTLNGCGWFDGKPSPLQAAPLRPGVDLQTTANGLPPAPNRGSYDAGVTPVDDSRSQPLGSIVAGKGGQKAQLEAVEKDRAEREAEREKERAQREAERNREKTEEPPQGAPPASPPSDQAPAPASTAPAPAPAPAPASTPAPAPVPEAAPSSPPAER